MASYLAELQGTAGVDTINVYHDLAFGVRDELARLDSCLRALREVLVGWKLDYLSRNLAHLVNTVQDLSARGVGPAGAPPARARRWTPRGRAAIVAGGCRRPLGGRQRPNEASGSPRRS